MPKSKLLWRIYTGHALLICATALIFGPLVARWIDQDGRRVAQEDLNAKAELLRVVATPHLLSPDPSELQSQVRALGAAARTRFTVIGLDGRVLADSREDPRSMGNHSDRPEFKEAFALGEGAATRHSDTLGIEMLYVALPVRIEGQPSFAVRAALPLTAIQERLAILKNLVFLGALAASLLALVLGFYLARLVTRPVSQITAWARGIAEGSAYRRLPILSRDEIGNLGEAINTMSDQLQERMQTILTDRNKLAAILESMVEGLVAVDSDERIVHLNPAARRILAIPEGDCLGRKIWEVTRIREVSESLVAAMTEKKDVLREICLPTSPRDRVIKLHGSPVRDSSERMAGAVVLLNDVTDLRRLETIRRDFVANVSHELKTPLTAIRGLIETMLDDRAMEPQTQSRFLEKVHRQAMRLSSLVTDLLTLSRVDSQDSRLETALLDLREPVEESVRSLRPSAETKKITLELAAPARTLVQGDKEALRQATDNLIDNAIKYTPEGGKVWVRIQERGGQAHLEVEDNGIGIEPQHQERIFERFYRVDKARSRELGGTGLGLSIVKHIALAHGGEAGVKSNLGQGSTFQITLPLDHSRMQEAEGFATAATSTEEA